MKFLKFKDHGSHLTLSLTLILLVSLHAKRAESMELDEVITDYQKTLPKIPKKGVTKEKTAFEATQYILSFLDKNGAEEIQKSTQTIDCSQPTDSLLGRMVFHQFYKTDGFGVKGPRDQKIGRLYQSILQALESNSPLVGYLYGSAFKSTKLYDMQRKTGKVLSRDVDLQERLEYETYKQIQEGLRELGLNFHFVVIRDDYLAPALDLSPKGGEKIYEGAPEIKAYGEGVKKIAEETGLKLLTVEDLEDSSGRSVASLIKSEHDFTFSPKNLSDLSKTKAQAIRGLKTFLRKEYDDELCSNKEKGKRASHRAKRYVALKEGVKRHEYEFLTKSFSRLFGDSSLFIPFSLHAENYMSSCEKIPLRHMSYSFGGCNAQHQVPLLQKKSDGKYIFYSIRGDLMKNVSELCENKIQIGEVGGYKTLLYEGNAFLSEHKDCRKHFLSLTEMRDN